MALGIGVQRFRLQGLKSRSWQSGVVREPHPLGAKDRAAARHSRALLSGEASLLPAT